MPYPKLTEGSNFFEKALKKFNSLHHFTKIGIFAVLLLGLITPSLLNTFLTQHAGANNHGQITYSANAQVASGLHALTANEYAVIEQQVGQPTGKKHTVAVKLGNGNTFSETFHTLV